MLGMRSYWWSAALLLVVMLASSTGESQQHTSNHAVIVSSSRYWFNYRHALNALAIYDLIKRHGIPDSHIVLMLADELPTNPRHPHKNHMDLYNKNLYSSSVEIDYRGDDVTVSNLAKVLLGRWDDDKGQMMRQEQLHSDEDANVLMYWTGHGGDQFFKFQDVEEITAHDIWRILQEMHVSKRYRQILFIADTCQAFTLGDDFVGDSGVPNVYFVGSSLRGENAYAHHTDPILGISVIERYTHAVLQFLTKHTNLEHVSLKEGLVNHLRFEEQRAHVGYSDKSCDAKMEDIPMSDFFANVVQASSPMEIPKMQEKVTWNVWNQASVADAGTATETCNAQEASATYYQGVEPSDPFFVALLMLFIGAIMISSQFV